MRVITSGSVDEHFNTDRYCACKIIKYYFLLRHCTRKSRQNHWRALGRYQKTSNPVEL